MANLGDLMGFGSGSTGNAGMNYHAEKAPIEQAVGMPQINQAYNQSQFGLNNQMGFMNALQGQNGIGNQQNVFAQQQALARQLQGVANGTGPNPALQQLQNTTGQNVANQAALMGSQRGASANAGLLARQVGMQGANIQQQAAGQGAALAAQQQLAGMGALQGQQANMANLSGSQVAQQAGAISNYNQLAQNEQQRLLDAMAQYNNANVTMQSNVNSANSGIAGITAKGQQDLQGGFLSGLSGASMFGAKGGMVQSYADGGVVDQGPLASSSQSAGSNLGGLLSRAGQYLSGQSDISNVTSNVQPIAQPSAPQQSSAPESSNLSKAGQNIGSLGGANIMRMFSGSKDSGGAGAAAGMMGGSAGMGDIALLAANKGGGVPCFEEGGMMQKAMQLAPLLLLLQKGGAVDGEALASQGKMIPGDAAVQGDSLKNDKIPAMLSPKEIVIPRSITMAPDAPEKAKRFVAAVLAKNGMGKKKK